MTETTLTHALDKTAIKAMRDADSICFDHDADPTLAEHNGIRAIKRGKAPWYEDTTVRVRARSSVYIHSDDDGPSRLDYDIRNGKTACCFDMIHCSKHSEEWQTIVSLLRAGDEVELRWVGSDNNDYLTRSTVTEREKDSSHPSHSLGERLYHDKLYLKVHRNGKVKYSFYLTDSICPDNTARMIKPYGR